MVGSILAGLFFSMVIMVHLRGAQAAQRGSFEKKAQMVGGVLCVIFFVLCITLFYTVVHPTRLSSIEQRCVSYD